MRKSTKIVLAILGFILALGVLSRIWIGTVLAENIAYPDQWAWGTNIGWINFKPADGGVTVYEDHLEGYSWGENIGWIRLGTNSGGGTHTYLNTTAENYGVNRDLLGNLSGFAWGTNTGWINFNPEDGGVRIDPQSGVFEGFAWGENIGWIHFRGGVGEKEYGVITDFRRFLSWLPLILNDY